MEYNRIIAITGLGGLFELLSSKSDGAIVRSLEDNQTKFVSSRLHNFSHLESIEVYTVRENINLVELFQTIKASGEALPSEKDPAATKAFFAKVYPDMDFERIYGSDMKKMVKWYSLLTAANVEFKLPAPAEEGEEAEEAGEDEAVATAPPATKTKAKEKEKPTEAPAEAPKAPKTKAPKAEAEEAKAPKAEAEEKPKKKAAKAEEPAPAKKAAPKKKKTDE